MAEQWTLTFSPEVYPFALRTFLATLGVIVLMTTVNRMIVTADSWWKRELNFIAAIIVFFAGMMLPFGLIGTGAGSRHSLFADNEQLLITGSAFAIWLGCCKLVAKPPKYPLPHATKET